MHKLLRKKAEELRNQGYSYNLIKEKLGVSKSTMSYWFKDKPFKPNKKVLKRIKNGPTISGIRRHNNRVNEIKELKEIGKKEVGKLSERDLWMLGLGLYIGEGSKTIETIRIVNSDPLVIKSSIKWLKEICSLNNENIAIALHLYPDNDIKKSKEYWSRITGLPYKNFRKIQIDRRKNKKRSKRGKLPYGTVHLVVVAKGDKEKGVKLLRRIHGWVEGAINQV